MGDYLHSKGIHFISKASYRYFIFNCNISNMGVIFNFITEIINFWCVLILHFCIGKCAVYLQVKYFINIVVMYQSHSTLKPTRRMIGPS
jgi:hypothetical protein